MEIKKGDIFLLGKHRLMCGDSLSLIDVQRLIDKKVSTMIFTDPPYSVNYVPEERRKGGRRVKELGGIMGDVNFKILDLLNLINTGICEGAVYICCGSKQVGPIYSWVSKDLKNRARMIIWVKNGYSILPGDYHSAYEQMMYFYFDNKKFRGERNQSDVWFVRRRATGKYVHPTQKPVRLIMTAIQNSSDAGDTVLDLFGGSGSTLMACERTDRICYIMELDPKYVEIIIGRWEIFTGKKAVKL